jgi:Tol biopolymer transport system component
MPTRSARYITPTLLALTLSGCEAIFGSDAPLQREILYTSCAGPCSLHAVRTDGSGDRLVADSASLGEWSPDGKAIVFVSARGGQWDLYVVRADGSGVRRLTNTPSHEDSPTWSPDGASIAYVESAIAGAVPRISRVDLDGTGYQAVYHAEGVLYDPDWSPDGRAILFEEDRRVKVVGATGANPRTLGGGEWPTYAPDGDRILFSLVGESGYRLATARVDGSDVRLLPMERAADADDYAATWSRDGRWVAFTRHHSGGTAADIYVVRSDGTGVAPVVSATGNQVYPSWRR